MTQMACHPPGHNRPIFNTLRPRQNDRHFPDDILKCIFLNETAWFSIKISLKFVPRGPINNISALAWHRPGNKPSSEPMMVILLMHIHVTRSQWVKQCTLTHWGRAKMDTTLQTTFSSAFSWMKMFQFRLKFRWSLFLRVQLTIFHHRFR